MMEKSDKSDSSADRQKQRPLIRVEDDDTAPQAKTGGCC